jgi:hypothetical protein
MEMREREKGKVGDKAKTVLCERKGGKKKKEFICENERY